MPRTSFWAHGEGLFSGVPHMEADPVQHPLMSARATLTGSHGYPSGHSQHSGEQWS